MQTRYDLTYSTFQNLLFSKFIYKYQTNLESETCAYEDQWRCGSGECISLDQLCDYSSDCIDGSGIVNSVQEGCVKCFVVENHNKKMKQRTSDS